jgi:hypothetical protein
MNEAVFLHGATDVRVALFTLRDGRPDDGIGSAIIHEQFVAAPARALVSPASE